MEVYDGRINVTMLICYTEDENLHLICRIETWEDDIIEDKISFKKDRGYLKIRDILKIQKDNRKSNKICSKQGIPDKENFKIT